MFSFFFLFIYFRFYYTHLNHWIHTADMHISIMFCYLRQLKEAGRLKSHLIIQTDNCWKDNKNRYWMSFWAFMIHLGWVDSVEHVFLPPGHSHDMVDNKCFKPIGRTSRLCWDIWTIPDFQSFKDRAFCGNSIAPSDLQNISMFAWSNFFSPFLRKFKWHSKFRAFLWKKQGLFFVYFSISLS